MVPENENVIQEPEVATTTVVIQDNDEPEVTTTPAVVPEEEEQEPEMLSGVVVDCAKLNVRRAPNATAPVIYTIARGTGVIVVEDESTDEFYKVYTETGVEGFCMKQYIMI